MSRLKGDLFRNAAPGVGWRDPGPRTAMIVDILGISREMLVTRSNATLRNKMIYTVVEQDSNFSSTLQDFIPN